MNKLTYAVPEEVGIPSEAVLRFIKRLDKYQIPMHSILIARYNKIITEAYYRPYKEDTLHRMFSISKSFTSIAVGLLAEEGRISLDDPIVTYFQDKLPDKVHPWIAAMTIRDMLRMETCHNGTTYKRNMKEDWVASFFNTEPNHAPGTVFLYDTSSSHTLCALVERLTKKPMLDYLRDKFLDDIGFSKNAYIISDPFGISMGGSGLMATPKDLLLVASAMMNSNNTMYNNSESRETNKDKEILPSWFVREAISHQTDNIIRGVTQEECQGYGYMFWITQHDGFVAYGMGGQLMICLPKHDLICVTTADTQGIQGGNQVIYNCLYEEILPYLSEAPLTENPTTRLELESHISDLSIKPVDGDINSPLMKDIHGRRYTLRDNTSGFSSLSLEFNQETMTGNLLLSRNKVSAISNNEEIYSISFGLGKMVIGQFPIYNQRCATSGAWLKPNVLYIKSHIIDECIGSIQFQLVFMDGKVTVYIKKIEETYFNEFNGFFQGE